MKTTSDTPKQSMIKSDFIEEGLRIVDAAKEQGLTMRLMGAIAFRIHCPKYGSLQERLGRAFTDIDFASYRKTWLEVSDLLKKLGYEEKAMSSMLRGWKRLVFFDPASDRHVDVFIEKLEMCHDIDFAGRLEIDYPTISLVDLLLEKMQIVQINEKDIIDAIMLFAEHNVGDGDKETINTTYLSGLCSKDWGLWKTVTMNLEKTKRFVYKYDPIETTVKDDVASKIDRTLESIEKQPKSLGWKTRARVGEKKKWYREVGEATA